MTSLSSLLYCLRALPAIMLFWTIGCAGSGSSSASDSESPAAPLGPSLIVVDGQGVARVAAGTTRKPIEPAVHFGGLYSVGSPGRPIVLSLRTGKATRLSLLEADGTFKTIHQLDGSGSYTVARSPEGSVAFGYEGSSGRGIGILHRDGTVTDVGCSVSSRALGWVDANRLVVGTADNQYVVAAKGCTTISRVDSRKMHEEAFNPMNGTVAYILRELEYDRNARQYVPDSSLYVANADGSNPVLIVGDRYKPHRPRWSPSGAELAFDARLPDHPNRRLISIYDTEQNTSAFLNPASLDIDVSEWDAHWSPAGTSIAYMQKTGSSGTSVAVRSLEGSFVTLVGESGERFGRWIDDDHLVLIGASGERVISTDGKTSIHGEGKATILRLE